MILPEIYIKRLLEQILEQVRIDFDRWDDESDTVLYHMFNENNYVGFNMYNQAKDLFIIRDVTKPRRIEINMMFNPQRVALPTVHITSPTDSDLNHGIGVMPIIEEGTMVDPNDEDAIIYTREVYRGRRYSITMNCIITSDNQMEVVLMYNFFKYMLTAVVDTIALLGFEQPSISGQELRLASSVLPDGIFAKSISISGSYDMVTKVPDDVIAAINKLVFYGTPKNE